MRLILFFFLILLFETTSGQYWIQHGSGATNNMGYAIAVDNSGNTYSTGYFSSSITFGAFTLTATGLIDMFLIKTDVDGAVVWVKHAGGTNVTQGLSLAVNANSVVVTGFFYASANFDAHTITSTGQQDVFIAKYDLNGNLLWVTNSGGSLDDVGNKIAFDVNDNILLTGEFASSDFTSGAHSLSSAGNSLDVFTARYDPSGNCMWLKSGSSPYIDRGTQITSDAAGNVYVAGEFSDTVQFDLLHTNVMFNALFLIKYDASGNEQWFRWFGSGNTVKMKGLEITATGDLISLGNYTSTLYYFGFPNSFTLSSPLLNNYFLSKISSAGDLIWAVTNGSNSAVSSECLAIKPNQEIAVGGTYQCRFEDFSSQYGSGVFCSLGYNDCFVASYNDNGNWQWSKCYGGTKSDYLFGIASNDQNQLCLAGAFCSNIFFAEDKNNFLGFPNVPLPAGLTYCNDDEYFEFIEYNSTGNSDVYIGKPLDPSREILDYFLRDPGPCTRNFRNICINQCEDTIIACNYTWLYANTFTNNNYSPEFHYLWNIGDTLSNIIVNVSGDYSVQITSYDGCFIDQDTMSVVIHPRPGIPTISDDKGINNNATNTDPVLLCAPDSVLLSAIAPPGTSYSWTGFPAGEDSVYVGSDGIYSFDVTDVFGCQNTNFVTVIVSSPLTPVIPKIVCLNDTDGNDTIAICSNGSMAMFIYDSLSNSIIDVTTCLPQENHTDWFPSDPSLQFSSTTSCLSGSINYFSNFTQDGWYTIDAHLVRDNSCAEDSFDLSINIYVIVNPVPPNILTASITGNTFICPGASTTIYAHGNGRYSWNSPSPCSGDSCVFSHAGNFSVTALFDTTNQFGCTTHGSINIPITIATDPLPLLSVVPASALICPFDSVQIACSGTGNFSWQGPNGAIPSNAPVIYVTTSGFYYCIRDDGLCVLNSNNVEVFQYNTPLLITLGPAAICNNQPVTLQIVTGSGSVVNWLPPLSGNSLTQTITNPGTYECNISTCNINTPLQIDIRGSNPVAQIHYSSLLACDGDSINLFSDPAAFYEWLPSGETTSSINLFSAGNVTLNVLDSLNCPASDAININFFPNFLQAPYSKDTIICQGELIELEANGSSTIHWLDEHSNQVSTGNTFAPGLLLNTTYFVLYSDSGGCTSESDTVNIQVNPCDTIRIPNVITPNGDGKNDLFPDDRENGRLYMIKIYNRWGKIVYDSRTDVESWNGKTASGDLLTEGVYYFILDVKFLNGRIQHEQGWIQVINE